MVFLFMFLFSCDDTKNEQTDFETLKNDMISKSGVLCELKPDTGPCRAYFPRYYFDQDSQKCKEFIWGGCYAAIIGKAIYEKTIDLKEIEKYILEC